MDSMNEAFKDYDWIVIKIDNGRCDLSFRGQTIEVGCYQKTTIASIYGQLNIHSPVGEGLLRWPIMSKEEGDNIYNQLFVKKETG